MFEIRHYLAANGRDIFTDWLKAVRDPIAKIQIIKRINRAESGNLGDHKFCRDGVWEMRIDTGSGYRVYYAQSGQQIILLLCGGDKRTQDADIERAVRNWQDWNARTS